MVTVTGEQWASWDAFYLMRRRLDQTLDAELQRTSSVSAPEYETLIALNRSSDRRLRAKDLAAAMGWEKSRVSHQVSRMEKRGLIERMPCETDGRGAWIQLTADGRRAVLGAMRGHTAALRRYFFDVLDEQQRGHLTEISGAVLAALGEPRDDDASDRDDDMGPDTGRA